MRNTLLLLTLALSGLLTSCGDEETKRQEDPAPVTHTGQWNTILVTRSFQTQNSGTPGTVKDETVGRGAHVINLSEQGSYEETLNGKKATGTYTRNNTVLTLSVPQPLAMQSGRHYIDSLTTNRMVLRDTSVSNGITTVTVFKLVR